MCLLVLVLEPSLACSGGLSGQTRWSQRRDWDCAPYGQLRVGSRGHGSAGGLLGRPPERRIVRTRCGQNDETRCTNLDACQHMRYREICLPRQFPSGMWRLRPISPPVAAGGLISCLAC